MPVACSTSALTGQEGSVYFKPAGTDFCLLDNTDFPAGDDITVPTSHDFKIGDGVSFAEEGGAALDTALTTTDTYFVVATTESTIQVSATAGGTAITLNGDGGVAGATGPIETLGTVVGGNSYTDGNYNGVALTGGTGVGATADITVAAGAVTTVTLVNSGLGYTVGDSLSADDGDLGGGGGTGFEVPVASIVGGGDTPGGHINIGIAAYLSVCQVREFSIDITREELDVTTLPCGVGSGSGKYAAFRSTQAGYASGTGTMTVYFTDDQTSVANRLLGNVLLRSQQGAYAKLYVNTVAAAGGGGTVDDAASLYIETGISITSMSLSVNPDDPTTAELSFNVTEPKNVLGAVIS